VGGRHRRDPGAAPSYPVIVGAGFRVAKLYQMLPVSVSGDPGARTPRTTRRCGTCSWPDKKVKLVLAYPMTTGRNLDEVPLVIDSRHLTARHRVAAPVNRQQGQDVLIAGSVCDEQDRDLYPDGTTAPPPADCARPARARTGGVLTPCR